MNRLKPASEALYCVGIRRMEAGQPLPLRMRTGRGKAVLAIGRAKGEHPNCKVPCMVGGAL